MKNSNTAPSATFGCLSSIYSYGAYGTHSCFDVVYCDLGTTIVVLVGTVQVECRMEGVEMENQLIKSKDFSRVPGIIFIF
ncbi:MAG: hypothetical protein GX817_06925 [Elusimicrobia bacterium]|nr:hypothetical protein [Elusimicrobiota bacterium]